VCLARCHLHCCTYAQQLLRAPSGLRPAAPTSHLELTSCAGAVPECSWCKQCKTDRDWLKAQAPKRKVQKANCSICKKCKPAGEFAKDERRSTGLDARCKACRCGTELFWRHRIPCRTCRPLCKAYTAHFTGLCALDCSLPSGGRSARRRNSRTLRLGGPYQPRRRARSARWRNMDTSLNDISTARMDW
jgi:hypothetical protein